MRLHLPPSRAARALALPALLAATAAAQAPRVQTDWSDGPGEPGPVLDFGAGFDAATGVAWSTLPGQVALAGTPLAAPLATLVDGEHTLARAVEAADVDGDGDADVLGCGYGRIDWWERLPGGGFAQHPIATDFEGPYALAPADLDLDGDLDVAVAAFYGGPGLGENGRFAWFENPGAGRPWTEHLFAEGYWGAESLDLADVDGDGDLDVCGISSLDDDVIWFENADGFAGAWIPHPIDQEPGAICVRAADLDGDGDPDLAVAAYGSSEVLWYENDGAGAFAKHPLFTVSTARYVDAGDLDGDGDLDLVAVGINSPSLLWIENLDGAGGAWSLHAISGWVRGERCLARDLDGDDDVDVVSSNDQLPDFAQVYWFENDGAGTGWTPHELDGFIQSVSGLAVGDVDDDGKPDVLTAYELQKDVLAFAPTAFVPSGTLTSSWVQRLPSERWWRLTWDASVPATASLTVEVRTAQTLAAPGPWVAVPAGGSIAALVTPHARFLQYRLQLDGAPQASPVVRAVTVGLTALTTTPGVPVQEP